MGYQAALEKAWKAVESAGLGGTQEVRFFSEKCLVDIARHSVLAVSGGPVKDFISILVLHYLKKRQEGLPPLAGEWISFKELEAGEQYYPAFRKRSIEPLLKKYGENPAGMRAPVCAGARGDAEVTVEAFSGVPLRAVIWKGDEDFPPEATILFDKSIAGIFCTEDVAVLSGFIAQYV